MVFTIEHEHRAAVWINTCLERDRGRVQYAYVIPEVVVTLITLQLTPHQCVTQVGVVYERTALSVTMNAVVRRMSECDRAAGPTWASQIDKYLAGRRSDFSAPDRPRSAH